MIGPAMDVAEWPSAGYTNAGYVYKPKDNLNNSSGMVSFLRLRLSYFSNIFH